MNVLKGLGGDDTIVGGAGVDTLYGGAGRDALTGGIDSADRFVFDTALDASTNVDRIVDFTTGVDQFWLDDAIFSKLTVGQLAANQFRVGTTAATASDRIIYDQMNGVLYYDADGAGGGSQIAFATVTANLALTNSDLFVI